MRFIDANVFLRHLTQDIPAMAAECTALLRDVEQGKVQAWTNDLVVAEVVFVLESAAGAGYRYARPAIQAAFLPLVLLPALRVPSKDFYPRIFELYTTHKIDFIDAYNAAHIEATTPPELYSYDRHYDRIPTVKRVLPNVR
jgi:predicted nucleic acid-binding protein